MGKFTIICPNCGSANQASNSWFAKKVISCGTCKTEINTKEARLISKICPSCGNTFVCDQAKMKGVKCPFCGNAVTSLDATAEYKYVTLNCPQCSCKIEVDKTKPLAVCPLCDCEMDVKKQLAHENLVKSGAISVIKYEGDNSSFIWKHPIEDFNLGSQLIVHESQEAIFFLNGEALDTFGPGRHTLETENIPIINKIYKIPTGGQNPFHAEVYFVNLAVQMGIQWGTPERIKFLEPESKLWLDLGASGDMSMSVADSRKLITKLVGTMKGLDWSGDGKGYAQSIKSSFKGTLITIIKSYLASVIKAENIDVFELNTQLEHFSKALCEKIKPEFDEYGLAISKFNVQNIQFPEDNPDFIKLKELKSGAYLRLREEAQKADIAKAAREAMLQDALNEADTKRIFASGEADVTRAHGFAEADIMRAKGYSEKDLIDADVQKAYAAGMGQFGANSGGGGGGGGGGVASDMVNMMMGMKVAGMMTDKLDGAFNPNGAKAAPAAPSDGWDCSCGTKGNTGKFCLECGKSKPEAWTCSCGVKGNTGKFCRECGKPKPEAWDCSCGTKGNTGKFCLECGKPKPEAWDCSCGTKGNTGKFCLECGKPKPAPAALWECSCGAKGNPGKFCLECGKPKPASDEAWNCDCGAKGITNKFCPECGSPKK